MAAVYPRPPCRDCPADPLLMPLHTSGNVSRGGGEGFSIRVRRLQHFDSMSLQASNLGLFRNSAHLGSGIEDRTGTTAGGQKPRREYTTAA